MKVLQIDPCKDPLWDRLIQRHHSSLFHSPLWIKALQTTYDFETSALLVLDRSDEPIAGVPFCKIHDFLGERIVSLPFSDYCDPLVEDKLTWEKLLEAVATENCSAVFRCLHNSIVLLDRRLTVDKRAKWHGLGVEPELDRLWRGMHSSVRRAVNKAKKEGVRVEIVSDIEILESFFQMHLKVRKNKYRLLAQPYQFFENVWKAFLEAEKLFMMVAIYQGKMIAGSLFIGWDRTLYYKFNASDPFYLGCRPNDLLIWEAIKLAKLRGYTGLDLGLSDDNQDGLIRFKRQFGCTEKNIVHQRYLPGELDNQPSLQEARNLLGKLTQLFTDESVPDPITAAGGSILYRFFA